MYANLTRLTVLVPLFAVMVGCSSITGTTNQSVSVQTIDAVGKEVTGSACELNNNKGKWFVTSPGSTTITRSNDDLQVLCKKETDTGRASVVSATKGSMFGNIIFGGGIGMIIDHTSGAAYEYPTFFQVQMGSNKHIDMTKPVGQQIVMSRLDGGPGQPAADAAAVSVAAPREPNAESAVPPARDSRAFAGEWGQRIEQLEKNRGQLTLARSFAILLQIDNPEELALLQKHDGSIGKLSWYSAYAIGADRNGNMLWGGSRNWPNAQFATDTAVEFCGGKSAGSCKVVVANGDFLENNFIEIAKQFGAQDVAATRAAYLRSLGDSPSETRVMGTAGGGGGRPAFGFASIR